MFPTKVGSGPLESLTVRQLRIALAGPHGYVKATAPFEASGLVEHAQGSGQSETFEKIPDDSLDSGYIAFGGGLLLSASSPSSPTSKVCCRHISLHLW